MNPQLRKYFALIVHYGPSEVTQRALNSLIESQDPPEEVIIVDHGQQPLSLEHPTNCHIIRPAQNRGYGAGINIGLGALSAHHAGEDDIIIAMNNDVQVTNSTLHKLRRWWHAHPGDALFGTGAHLNLWTGRAHLHQPLPVSKNHIIPYVHGSFFMAPYRVFLKLKGMPDHYFLYWEDVLLSVWASRQGIPLHTASSVDIVHQPAKSKQTKSNQLYYLVRNGALFLERETSWPWRHYWWAANRFRLIYHALTNHRPAAVRQGLRDAIHGTTGQRATK